MSRTHSSGPGRNDGTALEQFKDRLNLAPALQFVSTHAEFFERGVEQLLGRPQTAVGRELEARLEIKSYDPSVPIQLTPEKALEIITRLPDSILRFSRLQTLDYGLHDVVLAARYDENGEFIGPDFIPHNEFPTDGVHPQRIVLGFTAAAGDLVQLHHIPNSISTDDRAKELYQIAVLLHECFHTFELPRREENMANALVLEDGRTFLDWRRDFLQSLGVEQTPTSVYAAAYEHNLYGPNGDLLPSVSWNDFAVAEQTVEAFVAHQLGIHANTIGYTDFSATSFDPSNPFGTSSRRYELMKELSESSPREEQDLG